MSDSENNTPTEQNDEQNDEQNSDSTTTTPSTPSTPSSPVTPTVTFESLSEENRNKVTQLSEIIGSEREVAMNHLIQNDWDVQRAANSFFGGGGLPFNQYLNRIGNDNTDTNNNQTHTYQSTYTYQPYNNFNYGRRNHRTNDGEVIVVEDEKFYQSSLTEEESKRTKLSIFYSVYPYKVEKEDWEGYGDYPKNSYAGQILKLEMDLDKDFTFKTIRNHLMLVEGIDCRKSSCRVADTRLWFGFLSSPFILINNENEKISDFEDRIRTSIDGFHIILELRFLTEKFSLNRIISDINSPWEYMTQVWDNPKYVNWRSIKRGRHLHYEKEDPNDITERVEYISIECSTDQRRVFELKLYSDTFQIPKFLFY